MRARSVFGAKSRVGRPKDAPPQLKVSYFWCLWVESCVPRSHSGGTLGTQMRLKSNLCVLVGTLTLNKCSPGGGSEKNIKK